MNTWHKKNKKLHLLLLFTVLIHLTGCNKMYLQWWDEEMFLYRPSVIESAAMRSATTDKSIQIRVGNTLRLNYGLTLDAVSSDNPTIAQISIYQGYRLDIPSKTFVITGVSHGTTTVLAYLTNGKILRIMVTVIQ